MINQQPAFPELEQIKTRAAKTTNLVEKLSLMKEYLDKAKLIYAQGEGQTKQIEQQRATELGCSTDEEAEEYIQELEGDVTRLEQELNVGVSTIEEELGWV